MEESASKCNEEAETLRKRTQEAIDQATKQLTSTAEILKNDAASRTESALSVVNQQALEMGNLLEETRRKAAEIVTRKEVEHFSYAASRYGTNDTRWLVAAIILGLVLLGSSILSLAAAAVNWLPASTSFEVAQISLAKLLVFGVITYATSISVRAYLANRHNQAVNEHRANAIASFRALVEATSTPEQKDTILVHASSAVFSPQETAFIRQAGGNEAPTTIIGSLVRPTPTA